MRHRIAFFFAATLTAHAQIASFGITAGVPATSAPPYAGLRQDTGRWTVGPTIEFHLISGLSAEANALIRSYSFTPHDGASATNSYQRDVKAWDFPFLLKYRFTSNPVSPFLDAGYSVTHESYDVSTLSGHSKSSNNFTGPAVGVGVEFRHHKLNIAPEARYTHLYQYGNLLTVLVGFTF